MFSGIERVILTIAVAITVIILVSVSRGILNSFIQDSIIDKIQIAINR